MSLRFPLPGGHRLLPRLALVLLAAVSAGCGGGGGGTPAAAPLGFGPLTPATFTFDVPEGVNLPWVTVQSTVTGDVGQLNGKTLHVLVDDTLGLFQRAEVAWDPASSRATLSLAGRAMEGAGTRSGRVSLRVCLDAACQQRLNAQELAFDIRVRVRAGLRVGATRVETAAPFAAVPAPTLVPVTVPEGVDPASFRYSILPPAQGLPVDAFDLAAAAEGGVHGVRVTPRLKPVGRYEATMMIEASSNDAAAQLMHYRAMVPLVLEVTPSATPYAFAPASVELEVAHGQQAVLPFTVSSIAQSGGFALSERVYELERDPPEAAASPLRGQWLIVSGSQWVAFGCAGIGAEVVCLPRGSYHAVLRFAHHDASGVATGLTVDVPLRMTVR